MPQPIELRLATIGQLAAEGAHDARVGAWARKVAAAAVRACSARAGRRACHEPSDRDLIQALADEARQNVAYVQELPETLVSPGVLLDLGAGDCDDTTALVLAGALRLGVPPGRLGVRAGLMPGDQGGRGRMWHVWPVLRSGAAWHDADASTYRVEPGAGQVARVAGSLESVVTYVLPDGEHGGGALQAGAALDPIGAAAEAGTSAVVGAAVKWVEGAVKDVAEWLECLATPKTCRYKEQVVAFESSLTVWEERLVAAMVAAADAPGAPAAAAQMTLASAYLEAADWLLATPAWRARFGDATKAGSALSAPNGGTRSGREWAALWSSYRSQMDALADELGVRRTKNGTYIPRKPGQPTKAEVMERYLGRGSSLAQQAATPQAGGGGSAVEGLALPVLLYLGLRALGAGGLAPAAAAGALVTRSTAPAGGCGCGGRCGRSRCAPAGSPVVPIVALELALDELVDAFDGADWGDDEEAQAWRVIIAQQIWRDLYLGALSLLPQGSPPNLRPDPDSDRTSARLRGLIESGAFGDGAVGSPRAWALLSVRARLPQTARKVALLPLSDADRLAAASETAWMGAAWRQLTQDLEQEAQRWAAPTGWTTVEAVELQAQLDTLGDPLPDAVTAAAQDIAAAVRPAQAAGPGGGLIIAGLALALLAAASRRA